MLGDSRALAGGAAHRAMSEERPPDRQEQQNPPYHMPRITPNIFYDDPASALEWLAKAFGFETRMSMPGPDGAIIHAEMQVADSVVMMSPTSATDQWNASSAVREPASPPGTSLPQRPRFQRDPRFREGEAWRSDRQREFSTSNHLPDWVPRMLRTGEKPLRAS